MPWTGQDTRKSLWTRVTSPGVGEASGLQRWRWVAEEGATEPQANEQPEQGRGLNSAGSAFCRAADRGGTLAAPQAWSPKALAPRTRARCFSP